MTLNNTPQIRHILAPSDLSPKSQKALGFAVRIAEAVGAELTACHCAQAAWFSAENRPRQEKTSEIRSLLKQQVIKCEAPSSSLRWRTAVVENSFDAARDILNLARETTADLIVMKARPSVLSAFRFGSIVERVVIGAPCPVLLLPSSFLAEKDPIVESFDFHRILFDYDFSDYSDQLFQIANTLTRRYQAELHMLSVFKASNQTASEIASVEGSRTSLQTMIRRRMDDALQEAGRSLMDVPATVEWGDHASAVLRYAKDHQIDLICTTLAPPHFYFEKLYSVYLGNLLRAAECPILVKQSDHEVS